MHKEKNRIESLKLKDETCQSAVASPEVLLNLEKIACTLNFLKYGFHETVDSLVQKLRVFARSNFFCTKYSCTIECANSIVANYCTRIYLQILRTFH